MPDVTVLAELCGECQNFVRCEWLFQCQPDSQTCDFTPSCFLRKGRITHHFACDVLRTGGVCNCGASVRATRTTRPVSSSEPKHPSPPVIPEPWPPRDDTGLDA